MTKVIGEYLTSLACPVRLSNHYTESGVDKGFQPLCFGPSYIAARIPGTGM
jgi:hypothetical protein